MPTYEYECSAGHRYEHFALPSKAPRSTACPECCRKVVRLIGKGSPPIFKGDGFHRYTGS